MSSVESKPHSTAEYLPSLTQRIIGHCDPLWIILLGSLARGEAGVV